MRRKILTGFFMLILTSGVYGLAFGRRAGLDEKRLMGSAPEYRAEKLLNHDYYSKLGKYLSDRYPYRRSFIVYKNWIDYYVFNTSPSHKVHLGKDGWLYLRGGLYSYLKDDCNKKKRALKLARTLNSIEKLLKSWDKRLFFIVAPDKATIYPEHVGFERPQNNCGENFYELFLEALEKYPLQGFIRLDRRLIDAKKDFPLYYTTGTHWNDHGSLIAANTILATLSTPMETYSLPDVTFRKSEDLRDLSTMWALNLREQVDIARLKKDENKKIKIKKLKPLKNFMPHLNITTTAGPGIPLVPHTIIYRDSFMTMPTKMMEGSFKELDTLWTKNIPVSESIDFSALRDARIIIIEAVERNLSKVRIKERPLVWALGGGLRYKRGKHGL